VDRRKVASFNKYPISVLQDLYFYCLKYSCLFVLIKKKEEKSLCLFATLLEIKVENMALGSG
jgi:hypothetical protein